MARLGTPVILLTIIGIAYVVLVRALSEFYQLRPLQTNRSKTPKRCNAVSLARSTWRQLEVWLAQAMLGVPENTPKNCVRTSIASIKAMESGTTDKPMQAAFRTVFFIFTYLVL